MENVKACKKRVLALAAAACLCASLVAAPAAYAFYYVHGEEHVAAESGKGVIEVSCTVDATAQGGGVYTDLIMVPTDATVADCLTEMIVSSENQNGLEAIHDYGYASLGDYLGDKAWTCMVYDAGSQNVGTQTTFDTEGAEGESTPLERFDSVVFTLQ